MRLGYTQRREVKDIPSSGDAVFNGIVSGVDSRGGSNVSDPNEFLDANSNFHHLQHHHTLLHAP